MILGFSLSKWEIPEDWEKNKRRSFLERMKQFVVLDNGKEGEWPNGQQIYVRAKNSGDIAGTAKLFVPEWHKKTILDRHHGVGTKGIHLGRTCLHELVSY
jgi:hypothetical protein